MKALVIAPQPFFSPRGTPFSVYYRTLVTAQLGVEVDLLTYGEGQDVDIPGVRIIRIPRLPVGPIKVGPSGVKLVLDAFVLAWTVALLARNKYDFVHAHEESVFFGRWLKSVFGYKLVYDMHSSLPQQLTNFKFTTSKVLIRSFEKLENAALANADAVITICPELAEYAVPRMPDGRRHLLIENSIFDDVRLRNGVAASANGQMVPLPDGRPLVVYAGTFESYQGLDILIGAMAKVRERRPDALLLMVGGAPQQVEQMRERARTLGLENGTIFTGQVTQSLARRYTSRASVLTSPRIEGTNTPLKIYEQLASGIPLVATRIRSHTQVLDDRVAFLVEPTADSMAEGIVAALDDEPRRRSVVAAARTLYDTSYSRSAYEEKMRRLLDLLA